MTDEPLTPMTDEDLIFAIRMAIGRDIHGRMRAPARGERPWDVTARLIVDHFRLSGVRVFQQAWRPRTGDHIGRP